MNEFLNIVLEELKSRRLELPIPQYLPDDIVLDDYELETSFKFPAEYRNFLKEASDSMLNGKDALRITPERNHPRELLTAIKEARSVGLPEDWLPICEDNGDYFCIVPDGSVRFWDHNGPCDERWPDLATWIKEVWIEGN